MTHDEAEPGTRVRVHIPTELHNTYASGFAAKVQDKLATVEKINLRSINGREWLGPAALVCFDVPMPSAFSGGQTTHFWFPFEDLQVLS